MTEHTDLLTAMLEMGWEVNPLFPAFNGLTGREATVFSARWCLDGPRHFWLEGWDGLSQVLPCYGDLVVGAVRELDPVVRGVRPWEGQGQVDARFGDRARGGFWLTFLWRFRDGYRVAYEDVYSPVSLSARDPVMPVVLARRFALEIGRRRRRRRVGAA